jgi:hypothetical protein
MREVLLFPFQGMGKELKTLWKSLSYIVQVRTQLLLLVVVHLLKAGDSVSLAKDTWKYRLKTRPPVPGTCRYCVEGSSELRKRLHRGAIHEVTARTKLRRDLATMPLRNPDYLEQLCADPPPPRDFVRDSSQRSKDNSAEAARDLAEALGRSDEIASEAPEE